MLISSLKNSKSILCLNFKEEVVSSKSLNSGILTLRKLFRILQEKKLKVLLRNFPQRKIALTFIEVNKSCKTLLRRGI